MNEMQAEWAALDLRLKEGLQLNRRTAEARRTLFFLAVGHLVTAAIDVAILLWMGSFLWDQRAEPRFFLPGILLHAFLILSVVAQATGFILARGVDYRGPVATAQRRLAQLSLLRMRTLGWTFLLAPLVWIPLLIVTFKGLLHVDAYTFLDRTWLAGNVVFGVAFIPFALWVARAVARRWETGSFVVRSRAQGSKRRRRSRGNWRSSRVSRPSPLRIP